MEKKFLRTASSRIWLVICIIGLLTIALLTAMVITAFTADHWIMSDQPEPLPVWTALSQFVLIVIMTILALAVIIVIIGVSVTFLFDTSKPRSPSYEQSLPFKTLRDMSATYDATLVKISRGLVRLRRSLFSPFRAIGRWIDSGE